MKPSSRFEMPFSTSSSRSWSSSSTLGAQSAATPVIVPNVGASGAIEAAIVAMALERGTLPGTCNLAELDGRLGLSVLREAMAARPTVALPGS